MDRLTLSQAKERVAAVIRDTPITGVIDWTNPVEEALAVQCLHYHGATSRQGKALLTVSRALLAYAAHLSFQEGRAFELAAVKEALAEHVRGAKPAEFPALVAFGLVINSGLHHAEPEPVTPQARDIWLGDRMLTQIRCVVGENLDSVVVSDLYGDRAHRVETIADFVRNRRLVERDGKAVI